MEGDGKTLSTYRYSCLLSLGTRPKRSEGGMRTQYAKVVAFRDIELRKKWGVTWDVVALDAWRSCNGRARTLRYVATAATL